MIIIKEPDHRKFPRRPFAARVRIQDHIQGRASTGAIVDINPMGMLIETRRRFALGEVVALRFPSPEGGHDLRVSGEVVRLDAACDEHRGAVALEFFDLEDWIFQELCGYVYDAPEERALIVTLEYATAGA